MQINVRCEPIANLNGPPGHPVFKLVSPLSIIQNEVVPYGLKVGQMVWKVAERFTSSPNGMKAVQAEQTACGPNGMNGCTGPLFDHVRQPIDLRVNRTGFKSSRPAYNLVEWLKNWSKV